jgi:type I restriction enzyme S subunit
MTLPSYPSYKYSGAAWLAEVPEHWVVKKIKREFIAQSGTDEKTDHGPFPLFGANGVIGQSNTASIKKPCVLIGRVGSAGELNFITQVAGVSDNALIVSNRVFDAPRYDFYLFQAADIKSSVSKNAQPLITASVITDRLMAVPDDLCERIQIAHFLDHETARIDSLVEEQQRLIELLKEKRQAVISHAVTKGLDPTVPMKDSGVEWLGEVPVHWSSIQVGRVCRKVSDGPHFSPNYVDEGVMFLSARNIAVDGWHLDDAKFVSEEDYLEFCRRIVPEKGDVLYTKGGTTGIARVVDLDERFQVWVHVAVLKLDREQVDPYYMAFSLNSTGCYEQSQLHTRGATNQDLGLTRMIKIWFALPPREEQIRICEFLSLALSKIDDLIAEAATVTGLLGERRSALISAAVTGKIDVRGWQPPASAPTPELVQEAV